MQIFQPESAAGARVIGIIGRILLQYATFVYDGMNGSFELRLDVVPGVFHNWPNSFCGDSSRLVVGASLCHRTGGDQPLHLIPVCVAGHLPPPEANTGA